PETNVYQILTIWISTNIYMKPCDYRKLKHGRLYYENRYRPYLSGHTGTKYIYYCDYNYVTASNTYWDYIYCTKEGWVPAVQCHRGCVFNYVENGISPSSSRKYVQDQSIKVQCYPGYSLPNKENTIVCTESGWSPPPKCIPVSKYTAVRSRYTDLQELCKVFVSEYTDFSINKRDVSSCHPNAWTASGNRNYRGWILMSFLDEVISY
uniref:Sushi domain-containing protein n=1 Tax=Castor canadensis TaxID=51338 RepID=A0A8C0XKM5_CASCN